MGATLTCANDADESIPVDGKKDTTAEAVKEEQKWHEPGHFKCRCPAHTENAHLRVGVDLEPAIGAEAETEEVES